MSGSIEPIVPGQVIFEIGQKIEKCFILQKGSVHFFNSREEKVSGIAPNTMFGFTELVKGKSNHSTKAFALHLEPLFHFHLKLLKPNYQHMVRIINYFWKV